ncbi:hypothetical protein ES703_78219 [subsurface metagenome]
MSKAVSYYDWELQFKKPLSNRSSENLIKRAKNKESFNSLGISNNKYKEFMRNWKQKNL